MVLMLTSHVSCQSFLFPPLGEHLDIITTLTTAAAIDSQVAGLMSLTLTPRLQASVKSKSGLQTDLEPESILRPFCAIIMDVDGAKRKYVAIPFLPKRPCWKLDLT